MNSSLLCWPDASPAALCPGFDASELKRDWFMTEEVAFGEGIAPFFDARFRVASSLAETDVADLAGNLMVELPPCDHDPLNHTQHWLVDEAWLRAGSPLDVR